MATLAKLADELSSSPAVQKLPAAELGLQLERQSRLDLMIAARDRAVAELGLGSNSLASLAKEAIIGWPAASSLATSLAEMDLFSSAIGLAGGDRYGMQQQLEHVHAGVAALQATFDRAIIPEGLFSSFSESAKAAMPKDLLAGLEVSANLFGAVERKAFADSFGIPADTVAASLSAGRVFEQLDHAEWRKQIEALLTPQVNWHEQFAGIYKQVEKYNLSLMADALSASQAPAVLTRRPEPQPPPKRLPPPQSGNSGIQPAQPGQPAGELLGIAHDLLSGRITTPMQIVRRLLQLEQGSQQPPEWEFIERFALDYHENGWRYDNMAAFARQRKYQISRATADRYLLWYEAATGQQIRPGQGRAKRKGGR